MKKILFYSFLISIINYHIVVGSDLDLDTSEPFFVRQKTDTCDQKQQTRLERNRISARKSRIRRKYLLEYLEKEYGKNIIVDVKIPVDLEQRLNAKRDQELVFYDTKFNEKSIPYEVLKQERRKISNKYYAVKRRILKKTRFKKLLEEHHRVTQKTDLSCNTDLSRPQ